MDVRFHQTSVVDKGYSLINCMLQHLNFSIRTCFQSCLNDYPNKWLASWLAGWLTDWLADRLITWSSSRKDMSKSLVRWVTYWLLFLFTTTNFLSHNNLLRTGSFSWSNGRSVKLTTHLHLPPRLRIREATPPLPHTSLRCGTCADV